MTFNRAGLLLQPWVWVAGGVVVVVVLLTMSQCTKRTRDREEAVLNERLRVLKLERDSLAQVNAQRDTQYVRDTVRLTKVATKYTMLRDSVLVRLTDTVLVKETILAADTTIKACRETLSTCEQRVADRDRIIANERRTRATADSLHRVQLAKANPRIRPFISLGVDPFDTNVRIARAGLDVRVVGPISLTGDVAYHSLANHHRAGFVGFKVTF